MPPQRKPKLGQNFLVDDQARHRIVDSLGDISNRTVLEIGPGRGAITEILARRCRRLIAVELDDALAAELTFHFRDTPQVLVLHGDILQQDFPSLTESGQTIDVIGNLPYYITSDILLQLFRVGHVLRRAVLMMQREVADRISAQPGVRDYGLLSATTQLYAQADTLFTLPPSAFSPPPEVYSSVVRLHFHPRFEELAVDPAGFDSFLRSVFAQKRKTLANNLRSAGFLPEQITTAWPERVNPQARAEELSLESLAFLYKAISKVVSASS